MCGCADVWVYGCMGVWVCGCMVDARYTQKHPHTHTPIQLLLPSARPSIQQLPDSATAASLSELPHALRFDALRKVLGIDRVAHERDAHLVGGLLAPGHILGRIRGVAG